MPFDRDSVVVSLREATPEPPEVLLDWDRIEACARHRMRRRRSILAAAVVVIASAAVGLPAILASQQHGKGRAELSPEASASPSAAPPPADKLGSGPTDGYAGTYADCRASVTGDRLAAPFWLDFEHLNPPTQAPQHTSAQALAAYRSNPATRSSAHGDYQQVFFASYSRFLPASSAKPVWVVVSYHVTAQPSGGLRLPGQSASTHTASPQITDQTVVISDRTLRPDFVLLSMPSRCA